MYGRVLSFAGLSLVYCRKAGCRTILSLSDILYSEHNTLDKYYRTVYVISPPFENHLKVKESWFYEAGKRNKAVLTVRAPQCREKCEKS